MYAMQTVVDVSRLRHNIRIIKNRTGNMPLCAVVKADAYGHGNAVAGFISPLADCFMVANFKEALEILPTVDKPIIVLGGDVSQFSIVEPQIVPTVSDLKQLAFLLKCGYKNFSVAVNTGMNRLGADEARLGELTAFCKQNNIAPWSVYSHIYGGLSSVNCQQAEFERLTRDPILRGRRHLFSSCALDLNGYELYDMIRPGIAMYGFSSCTECCIKVRAKITAINIVEKGGHVGYGDYILDRDATVATVAMGYADGLRRCDKQLYLTVRGKKCKIIGVPCMDMCMIDITGLEPRVGEFAYLVNDKADVEYLAKCYGTIVYEVLTGFNGRTERVFI